MDVSIIIVNYNTVYLLLDAIESILKNTKGINYEIIVVDNNSKDGVAEVLTNRFDKKIKFIALPENIGFGRANNKGLEFAKGRNILFLNPDTKLINNAIKILSEFLDNSPTTGACGANLLDENMKPAHSFKRFFPSIIGDINETLGQFPERLIYGKNINFNYTNNPLSVAYIFGADLMIKKNIIDNVGAFNPSFFMYAEEAELCLRIKNSGLKIMSVPSALIQHLEGKSFSNEKINEIRLEMQERGRFIFYDIKYKSNLNVFAKQMYKINLYIRICILNLYNRDRAKYMRVRLKKFVSLNNDKK